MADPREAILARLLAICDGLSGIEKTARNRLDVTGLSRPAIILHDGAEERQDAPQSERRSRIQRMAMSPRIDLLLAAGAEDAGTLANLYRARLIKAVLTDATLADLVGVGASVSGEIRFESFTFEPPTPDAREIRAEVNFVFVYIFRSADL